MFKEHSTEKLIEYIQTLPDKEQKLIVRTIEGKRKAGKQTSTVKDKKKSRYHGMERFLKNYRGTLPAGFKFDREEANAR